MTRRIFNTVVMPISARPCPSEAGDSSAEHGHGSTPVAERTGGRCCSIIYRQSRTPRGGFAVRHFRLSVVVLTCMVAACEAFRHHHAKAMLILRGDAFGRSGRASHHASVSAVAAVRWASRRPWRRSATSGHDSRMRDRRQPGTTDHRACRAAATSSPLSALTRSAAPARCCRESRGSITTLTSFAGEIGPDASFPGAAWRGCGTSAIRNP